MVAVLFPIYKSYDGSIFLNILVSLGLEKETDWFPLHLIILLCLKLSEVNSKKEVHFMHLINELQACN